MLFSNWIVTPGLPQNRENDQIYGNTGLCLVLDHQWQEFDQLLRGLQGMEFPVAISFLLTEESVISICGERDRYIDLLMSLFFQPTYFMLNECPVVFCTALDTKQTEIMAVLERQCIAQGFNGILPVWPADKHTEELGSASVIYETYETVNNPDVRLLLEKWIEKSLNNKDSFPIFLLIDPGRKRDDPAELLAYQKEVMGTTEYKIAESLYLSYKKIAGYEQQIRLKDISEKNKELYLEIQKQDLAIALDWYKYEYEILPLWYKQFGHILKVLMGKRTFRSLFNDNVKKYKD